MDATETKPERAEILGIPVDFVTTPEFVGRITRRASCQEPVTVFAGNPEKVMASRRDIRLASALWSADIVLPDGIGIVLAHWVLNGERGKRLPGIDAMSLLLRLAEELQWPAYFLGARHAVVSEAVCRIADAHPGLEIAGFRNGYFSSRDQNGVLAEILESEAEILFVGMGSPRQELWVHRSLAKLHRVRVCQTVGGSFDVWGGATRRAPVWTRRAGLEWVYRLLLKPSRWRRQIELPRFVLELLRARVALS